MKIFFLPFDIGFLLVDTPLLDQGGVKNRGDGTNSPCPNFRTWNLQHANGSEVNSPFSERYMVVHHWNTGNKYHEGLRKLYLPAPNGRSSKYE